MDISHYFRMDVEPEPFSDLQQAQYRSVHRDKF